MSEVELAGERVEQATDSPRAYYEENGYYVWRNLVPGAMIDSLLECYGKDIVPSQHPFFRQNTDRYEPNRYTEYGYVKQSFMDIHDYRKFPQFSVLAKEIYTGQHMRDALAQVTGFDAFNLMQTMLFDANTATNPHQDCWYLDSVPNGHLLAVWIALEDIDEKAGRFYVMPKSHRLDFHSDTPGLSHRDWLKRITDYMHAHPEQVHAPALKKGDALFWNSHTIHGALSTQDPSFSRKSLTAHYLPSRFEFGDLFITKKDIKYREYKGMKFYVTHDDDALQRMKADFRNSSLYSSSIVQGIKKAGKLLSK